MVANVQAAYERSPLKSLRRASRELQVGLPKSTLQRIVHKRLKLYAYKVQLMQHKVYAIPVRDFRDLRERIIEAIESILEDILQCAWQEIVHRLDIVTVTAGAHVEIWWRRGEKKGNVGSGGEEERKNVGGKTRDVGGGEDKKRKEKKVEGRCRWRGRGKKREVEGAEEERRKEEGRYKKLTGGKGVEWRCKRREWGERRMMYEMEMRGKKGDVGDEEEERRKKNIQKKIWRRGGIENEGGGQ
ncbi:hypothetical protein ANN_23126 [Periplaneta americana]|uniref:Uncharacterized protein n=1 Tax=Periplaneta americana TaxID=6978 RepID=A0ABQ8SK74_PERAM|nr:hypothetical protein ANN_23126 [Periplaneta americana]